MSGQKGFSRRELAEQNSRVEELGREESKLVAAIARAERSLSENRDRLKDVQRRKLAEGVALEQLIQRGLRTVSKGDNPRRSALVALLLLDDDADASPGATSSGAAAPAPPARDPGTGPRDGGPESPDGSPAADETHPNDGAERSEAA